MNRRGLMGRLLMGLFGWIGFVSLEEAKAVVPATKRKEYLVVFIRNVDPAIFKGNESYFAETAWKMARSFLGHKAMTGRGGFLPEKIEGLHETLFHEGMKTVRYIFLFSGEPAPFVSGDSVTYYIPEGE